MTAAQLPALSPREEERLAREAHARGLRLTRASYRARDRAERIRRRARAAELRPQIRELARRGREQGRAYGRALTAALKVRDAGGRNLTLEQTAHRFDLADGEQSKCLQIGARLRAMRAELEQLTTPGGPR